MPEVVRDLMDEIDGRLSQLAADGLMRQRRVVDGPQGPVLSVDGRDLLAFASNDYLGLANHPQVLAGAHEGIARFGVGAGASPIISGHSGVAGALEDALAAFVGTERALHFSTGYMANLGIIPALVGKGDVIFADRLSHACLIDGARLSGADFRIYPHNDVAKLAALLAKNNGKKALIVTDGVFSMDGDVAPLRDLLALAEKHDAWLLVDDAHGFGVLGPEGRGSVAAAGLNAPRIVYMATLGKAAGVAGAFVAGEGRVIEWLVQRARTYMFSTASPPLLSSAVLAALEIIRSEDWRRAQLQALATRLRDGVVGLPWDLLTSRTAIQPLMVGDNDKALAIMAGLKQRGIWVPAIRPPTVPKGTARLRISLSAAHSLADVDRLVAALREIAAMPIAMGG